MKGISLTIESIVIIVLALLVLAALFLFFGGIFTPSKDNIYNTAEHARWCKEYISLHPDCEGDSRIQGTNIQTKLDALCTNFEGANKYRDCCASFCGESGDEEV